MLRVIIYKIRSLEQRVEEVSYRFVRRDANMSAHILAKEGRQWSFPQFWVEKAPTPVEEVTEADWLKCCRQGRRSVRFHL